MVDTADNRRRLHSSYRNLKQKEKSLITNTAPATYLAGADVFEVYSVICFNVIKGLLFSPFCYTILILKFVDPIETECLFGYKPQFLGSKRLAFLGII